MNRAPRVLLVALALAAVPLSVRSQPVSAACSPPMNAIACENSNPGTPQSTWDINGSGDASIQGFATDISVNVGTTVHFKINTPANAYHLDIYRMGYYGGNGARLITTVHPLRRTTTEPTRVYQPDVDGARRLRQLGGIRLMGSAVHRDLRHLFREA